MAMRVPQFLVRPGDLPSTQPRTSSITAQAQHAFDMAPAETASGIARARWIWNYRGQLAWLGLLRASAFLRSCSNLLLPPLFVLMGMDLMLDSAPPLSRGFYTLASASFFAEWAVGLVLARSRRDYLLNAWLLADVLSALPLATAFQSLRLTRLARLARFARVLHVAKARRFRFPLSRVAQVAGVALSAASAGALALAGLEPDTTPDMAEAMWWAMVTMTTVGIGVYLSRELAFFDPYPIPGRERC